MHEKVVHLAVSALVAAKYKCNSKAMQYCMHHGHLKDIIHRMNFDRSATAPTSHLHTMHNNKQTFTATDVHKTAHLPVMNPLTTKPLHSVVSSILQRKQTPPHAPMRALCDIKSQRSKISAESSERHC